MGLGVKGLWGVIAIGILKALLGSEVGWYEGVMRSGGLVSC
jgi:hypothetical protein